jgi:hypothetical protein
VGISSNIAFTEANVRSTVDLDNQLVERAEKIQDIPVKGNLPPELQTVQLSVSEFIP